MDSTQLVFVLIGVSVPIFVYFWRESRYRNPSIRWRQLAPALEFEYEGNPARVGGQWKGRDMVITAQDPAPDGSQSAVLSASINCPHAIRLEIGPRDAVEKDSGIIVPDRVHFRGPGDSSFNERFLVRATPLELGETAIDASWRQRLMAMKDARILAVSNRLDMTIPLPTEASEMRDWLDLAASLCDAIDGT